MGHLLAKNICFASGVAKYASTACESLGDAMGVYGCADAELDAADVDADDAAVDNLLGQVGPIRNFSTKSLGF